ncbi:MAG: type II toxin-antitoxin system HicB family antitoxin [Bacteroidota bacterium]
MKFEVIIEQDETGYFVAEVPALPGCFTQGKTVEEATVNIKEAIEGWLEVMNEKSIKERTEPLTGNHPLQRIQVNV